MTLPRGKHTERGPFPLGTIRLRVAGEKGDQQIRMIKVRDRGPASQRWMNYSRWWWLTNKGPIPRGRIVVHKDGNLLNDDPSNFALGTHADVAFIWLSAKPGRLEKNIEAMRSGTRAHNAMRAKVKRAASWLSDRWYPVDHSTRTVHNRPTRSRWQVWREMGFDVRCCANGYGADAAALGWPGSSQLSACILAVLSAGGDGVLTAAQLRDGVDGMYRQRGEPRVKSWGGLWQGIAPLLHAGLLVTHRFRSGPDGRVYSITAAGMAARQAWTPIVPMRGSWLLAGACAGYTKLDPALGVLGRVGSEISESVAAAKVRRAERLRRRQVAA